MSKLQTSKREREAVDRSERGGGLVLAASQGDRELCGSLLPKVSRTFALSIAALPPSLREAVCVAYLLCRIVDTIEDDADLARNERERAFDAFERLLGDDSADPRPFERMSRELGLGGGGHAPSCGDTPHPDSSLCTHAGAPFRVFRGLSRAQRSAIRPHVAEMAMGMREYTRRAETAGKLRLADLDELERYCHYVAGTVGKLLTALFELEVPSITPAALAAARARAISFGIALQLVNIVKDVAEDHGRGDCYLPENLARQAGVELDRLLEPSERERGLAVVRGVCRLAREHLRRAEEYTRLWPMPEGASVRMFCTVPLALALATLREVERGADTLVPGRTPKVSRELVMQLFRDAPQGIQRDDTLAWMLCYYANGAGL